MALDWPLVYNFVWSQSIRSMVVAAVPAASRCTAEPSLRDEVGRAGAARAGVAGVGEGGGVVAGDVANEFTRGEVDALLAAARAGLRDVFGLGLMRFGGVGAVADGLGMVLDGIRWLA
jgi:hypothetical protein